MRLLSEKNKQNKKTIITVLASAAIAMGLIAGLVNSDIAAVRGAGSDNFFLIVTPGAGQTIARVQGSARFQLSAVSGDTSASAADIVRLSVDPQTIPRGLLVEMASTTITVGGSSTTVTVSTTPDLPSYLDSAFITIIGYSQSGVRRLAVLSVRIDSSAAGARSSGANSILSSAAPTGPDFVLAIAPGSAVAHPGETISYAISADILGASGTSSSSASTTVVLDLRVSSAGLPDGIRAELDSSQISSKNPKANLKISIDRTVAFVGPLFSTVTATSRSGISHSIFAMLTVIGEGTSLASASDDFTLIVDPPGVSYNASSGALFSISARDAAGANSRPVALSVDPADLPVDVTATLSSSSITTASKSAATLKVTLADPARAESYIIIPVRAARGQIKHTGRAVVFVDRVAFSSAQSVVNDFALRITPPDQLGARWQTLKFSVSVQNFASINPGATAQPITVSVDPATLVPGVAATLSSTTITGNNSTTLSVALTSAVASYVDLIFITVNGKNKSGASHTAVATIRLPVEAQSFAATLVADRRQTTPAPAKPVSSVASIPAAPSFPATIAFPVVLCQKMITPVFAQAGFDWEKLIPTIAPGDTIIVRLAPTGPGPQIDQTASVAIQKIQEKGGRVYGWVETAGNFRDAGQVKNDIANYQNWYGLDGVVLAGVATDETATGFYADLIAFTRNNYALPVAGMFLGIPDRAFANLFDQLIFELDGAFYGEQAIPDWAASYPPGKFAHLLYNVAPQNITNAITQSREKYALSVAATDQNFGSRWTTTPSYQAQVRGIIQSGCSGVPIAQPQTSSAGNLTLLETLKQAAQNLLNLVKK